MDRLAGTELTSQNCYHFHVFGKVKSVLGDKPLVLDCESSYLELRQALVVEEVNFVIRRKLGAHFFDVEEKLVALNVKKGETRLIRKYLIE